MNKAVVSAAWADPTARFHVIRQINVKSSLQPRGRGAGSERHLVQQMATNGVNGDLKPHLRSMTRYMFTVPNMMDYVRIVIYLAAVHGHFMSWWWAMPATIMCVALVALVVHPCPPESLRDGWRACAV